jgi:hypothetical protein
VNFLPRLERYFGWIAVGGLPIYIVAAQAIPYIWTLQSPEAIHWLSMDPYAVQSGEYWRVLTFLFIVPFQNPILVLFYLYFQYFCGVALEEEWGSFRFTLFYLFGVVMSIAAAFLVGGDVNGAFYLNETTFLAFAAMHPNFQVLFFFIIPLRVKWIAWLAWAQIIWSFIPLPWIWKIAVLLSLSNYFVFLGASHATQFQEWFQRMRHKQRHKNWPSE